MGAGKDRVDSPNARRSCEEQFTQYVSAFLVLTSLISGRINSYLFFLCSPFISQLLIVANQWVLRYGYVKFGRVDPFHPLWA